MLSSASGCQRLALCRKGTWRWCRGYCSACCGHGSWLQRRCSACTLQCTGHGARLQRSVHTGMLTVGGWNTGSGSRSRRQERQNLPSRQRRRRDSAVGVGGRARITSSSTKRLLRKGATRPAMRLCLGVRRGTCKTRMGDGTGCRSRESDGRVDALPLSSRHTLAVNWQTGSRAVPAGGECEDAGRSQSRCRLGVLRRCRW